MCATTTDDLAMQTSTVAQIEKNNLLWRVSFEVGTERQEVGVAVFSGVTGGTK